MANFKLDVDADGIALVTWDMPGRSMNVIDADVIAELADIVEKVAADAAIKGAVITSGKDAFCAGADLTMLETLATMFADWSQDTGEEAAAAYVFEESRKLSLLYRRLETCGKPWVCAHQRHRAWAAASSSRSPAIIASPPTTRRRGSACPKSRSACSPAPAAPSASRA